VAVAAVVVATEFVVDNVNFVVASYDEEVAVDADIVVGTVEDVADDGHDVVDRVLTPAHYLAHQFDDDVVVVAGNAVAVVGAVAP